MKALSTNEPDRLQDLRRIRGGLRHALDALAAGDLKQVRKLLQTSHRYVEDRLGTCPGCGTRDNDHSYSCRVNGGK